MSAKLDFVLRCQWTKFRGAHTIHPNAKQAVQAVQACAVPGKSNFGMSLADCPSLDDDVAILILADSYDIVFEQPFVEISLGVLAYDAMCVHV